MAASNRHRKILEYPIPKNTTTFPFCFVDCNPQLNPTGLCSPDCIPFCPSFCRPTESSPTPSPATSPHPLPSLPDHHNPPLSLPLKISLIFLITTFIYTLYKVYTVWHRSRPHRNPPPPPSPENQESDDRNILDHPIWYIRTVGLPPSVIKGLTVVNFNKIDGTTVDGTDCSVCLTEFEEDDTLRLLPNCNHAFHMPCIDTWLRSHTNCPLCRAVIVSNSVDTTSLEQNDAALEINLGISFIRDGDRGEASGSTGLRIGETDEDDVNNNSMKREV